MDNSSKTLENNVKEDTQNNKKDNVYEVLKILNEELKKIKTLLILSIAQKESEPIKEIEDLIDKQIKFENPKTENSSENASKSDKKIEEFRKIAINRVNSKTNQTEYLLHRATPDNEYEKSTTSNGSANIRITHYSPKENTEWFLTFSVAESSRIGANPVVSCWIPEKDIISITGMQSGAIGAWKDLGENPSLKEIKAIVQPGTYEIYQELKKSRVFKWISR